MNFNNKKETDFLIIGSGIIGLATALNIKKLKPKSRILIIDKESDTGFHASGRNSGVLHAGFYYSPDSLKARFTKEGNEELTRYCEQKNLKINKCGKVVVAKSEEEIEILFELKRRGDKNGVETYIVDEKELKEIEPNAKTLKYALWSPKTSTFEPLEVLKSIKQELEQIGVEFLFSTPYRKKLDINSVLAGESVIEYEKLINSAGLQADKIAKDFGFSENYVIVPFKGLYLETDREYNFIKRNIYPVPNIKNPFLGVHFTVGVDGRIKIGPTVTPSFSRENYNGLENLKLKELYETMKNYLSCLIKNKDFRRTLIEETKKYSRTYILNEAEKLVVSYDKTMFKKYGKPGIRAQLVNSRTYEFVYDFVVEGDSKSIHILNAVSPAFTASLPFTRYAVEKYVLGDRFTSSS